MKLAQTFALRTYDETSDMRRDIKVLTEEDGVTLSMEDDHMENPDGTITPPMYGRAVKIELDPAGNLKVHLYALDKEEPVSLVLTQTGEVQRLE